MGKREKIKCIIREKVLRFDEDNKKIILLLLKFFLNILQLILKNIKIKKFMSILNFI